MLAADTHSFGVKVLLIIPNECVSSPPGGYPERLAYGTRRFGPRNRKVTSLIVSRPRSTMRRRPRPRPNPPCDGQPYLKQSRYQRIGSGESPFAAACASSTP